MLVEFRLGNYRSYAAEQRLSMVAGAGRELPDNVAAVEGLGPHALLKGAAIYGANASGKSNLIQAFRFLRRFVLDSAEGRGDRPIDVTPFLLDPANEREPSTFEIMFLLGGVRYQFGCAVGAGRVHEEWLTAYPRGRPQEWYHRRAAGEGPSSWSWSRAHFRGDRAQLAGRTRDDALFLSVAAQWNHPQIEPIYRWFRDRLAVILSGAEATAATRRRVLEDPQFRDWVTATLRVAGAGIDELSATELKPDDVRIQLPKGAPDAVREFLAREVASHRPVGIMTKRRLPARKKGTVTWGLNWESGGTQRLFDLLGPIYRALREGGVFVIDELDTSLHPLITREIIRLFHDPKENPGHAQIVFTTHDSSLLDLTLLRRDQIWFAEKSESGATELYSLQDFSPRMGEAVQKGYLAGRYAAVPILGGFEPPPPRTPSSGPED